MNKLVSIITPCYNGELFLQRWANSIFLQTYRPIELILIDDGSTDRTESIFDSYHSRLVKSGITSRYIYQNNSGPAAATNQGLARFEGEYLSWMDSDDYLFPQSIERRVRFLEEHREYGLVRSDGVKTIEQSPFKAYGTLSGKRSNRFNTSIFEDILMSKTFITAGCYMARKSAFLKVYPKRSIYQPLNMGQNYQMLLPLTFSFRCGYIDEPLMGYVVRKHSRARTWRVSFDRQLARISGVEDIVLNVLDEIGGKANKYTAMARSKYARLRLELAYRYNKTDLGRQSYQAIKQYRSPTLQEHWWFISSQAMLPHFFVDSVNVLSTALIRRRKVLRAYFLSPWLTEEVLNALIALEDNCQL